MIEAYKLNSEIKTEESRLQAQILNILHWKTWDDSVMVGHISNVSFSINGEKIKSDSFTLIKAIAGAVNSIGKAKKIKPSL